MAMVATSASAWLDALELHANEPGTDDMVLHFVKRGDDPIQSRPLVS